MKITRLLLITCHLFFSGNSFSQKYRGEFSEVEFKCNYEKLGSLVDMFETRQQMMAFLEMQKGNVVAEVGAGDGVNMGVFSLLYDSITFYVQEVSTKLLSPKKLNKKVRFFTAQKTAPQTNTFKIVMGNANSSNLPDSIFDKILLINTLHDIDNKDVMLDDISKKLKQNGELVVLDGFSFKGDTQTCRDYGVHVLNTLPIQVKLLERHGFYVTKMRSPDFNAAHYGNGLFLERDKQRSEAFYKKKSETDPLVEKSFRFKQALIASDSMAMRSITDSLLNGIKEINETYKEFEVWIKDIGIKYLRKMDYTSALNIFKTNTVLYPYSYQSFYWLGVAYQESKKYDLALRYLNQSLTLNSVNTLATSRIKQVEKLKKQ